MSFEFDQFLKFSSKELCLQKNLPADKRQELEGLEGFRLTFFLELLQLRKENLTLIILDLIVKYLEYKQCEFLLLDTVFTAVVRIEHRTEKVELKILKVFQELSASLLLKSVREIYQIYLASKSAQIQKTCQAILSGIINQKFNIISGEMECLGRGGAAGSDIVITYEKVMKNHLSKKKKELKSTTPASNTLPEPQTTLSRSDSKILVDDEQFDESDPFSMQSNNLGKRDDKARDSQELLRSENETGLLSHDKAAKDAFLIFRAFCKLAIKPIQAPDSATDLKSQSMRSKLLSLSLVYTTLKNHQSAFMFPSPILFNDNVQSNGPEDVCFLVAVRRYISLVFTRNISNIIPQVFDISMDIFTRILDLRVLMKKEISIIFTQILIPIIEASVPCTFYQRVSCIRSLQRAFTSLGGQVIVELYLNYDCDESLGPEENIYERFINSLANLTTSNFGEALAANPFVFDGNGYALQDSSITTEILKNYTKDQIKQLYNSDGDWVEMKRRVNELIVKGILKPLYEFSRAETHSKSPVKREEEVDEVLSFENSKNKKLRLAQAIKLFTSKPLKALKILTDSKIISPKPKSIAHFLLNCPGLDKTSIGEVLGMGEDYYVEVMHCFVDMLDFTSLTFVKGLRKFLTHFRLPGEAQKIDRLMLKFAQRYLHNNPSSFSSADTAYVLSYSTIMLNTDMYNPQVKNRMNIEGFVKNNSGIDGGKDLPLDMVEGIYKEIREEEIKMTTNVKVDAHIVPEAHRVSRGQSGGGKYSGDLYSAIKKYNGATRDPYSLDTQFKSLSQSEFVKTGHPGHVKPMFQLVWMSFLMMTFSALQKGDNGDVIVTALEGFKYSIHIACRFELWLEMKAFITNLTKFVELGKILEISEKNVEAVKMLLEVAYMEGNHFEDWTGVVKCISQLEVIQSSGMPDPDPTHTVDQRRKETKHIEEIYAHICSQSVTLSVDRIFASSVKLNGKAMLDFARALCEMSWDEIISSSSREHPRMYSLQKLLEICHYNITTRIRIEWSQVWGVIGSHINQVGCHSNPNVVYFCIDKLRQLATKFLDIVELPNFKFQKDFLKPFLFIFENNPDVKIKDMVLTCVNQMILQKSAKLVSGWKALFSILSAAALEPTEAIVRLGFNIVSTVHRDYIDSIVAQGVYAEFIETLTKYCHCERFPKINAQAVTVLRQGAERLHKDASEIGDENEQSDDPSTRLWMVTFHNMKKIIMTCELEVRSKALTDLFEILLQNGNQFKEQFWLTILKDIILPLFAKLSTDSNSKDNGDEAAIWMSTTLVGALKLLVDLYSAFPILTSIALEPFLDLLVACVLQENDTLAKLGSASIVDFIERNCHIFDDKIWDLICERIVKLFNLTRPVELFFAVELPSPESELVPLPPPGFFYAGKPTRKEFPKIIVKCVLHLVVIQTLYRILTCSKRDEIYTAFSQKHVFLLGDALYKSYLFAQKFNEALPLREALHQMGFMKQLPNLVKQETSSVACYIILLSKMYNDNSPQQRLASGEIEKRLLPLSYKLMEQYLSYDPARQQSSVASWTPVVESIVLGFSEFGERQFEEFIPNFYAYFVKLVGRPFAGLENIFSRTGAVYRIPSTKITFSSEIGLFPSLGESVSNELDRVATALVESSLRESVSSLIEDGTTLDEN